MHSLTLDPVHTGPELDVYGKRGLTLVSGQGAEVTDKDGRRYIDCVGGHGAANIGHGHPRLLAAIGAQAARLMHCPGAFDHDVRTAYLTELTEAAPAGLRRAFLCNSGAEAVEAALKFARLTTGRPRFLAARRGFHGRTFGAMSATFNPNYSRGCEPLFPGFTHVPYNDVAALEAACDDTVAALILEVVQGEGGVRPAEPAYLAAARNLCDRHGILLIVDEVQTGFGRTGSLFACAHYGLHPDMLCLAKSIAGGLPMGAVVVADHISAPIGKHGSTFGGNPLACAAAREVLAILRDEDLCRHAAVEGAWFADQLRALRHDAVREVRGMGLMVGLELGLKVKPLLADLAARGVLALAAGPTVLRFLPPLVISHTQLAEVVDAVAAVLADY